ncbi:MAG: hypothetical protein AAGE80_15560 [Pseudomonadota bacterium]
MSDKENKATEIKEDDLDKASGGRAYEEVTWTLDDKKGKVGKPGPKRMERVFDDE